MSLLPHFSGLLGSMLLLIALPLIFIRQPRYGRKAVTVFLFFMMAVSVIPVYDLIIAAYIRGITGDLSVTSLFLLCIMIAEAYTGKTYFSEFEKARLHRILLVAGLILYPSALGLFYWDSYAAGYGSLIFLSALAGLSVCLIIGQSWFILSCLLLAIFGYLNQILTSTNLWDYLIDIWLMLLVIMQSVWKLARKLLYKNRSSG